MNRIDDLTDRLLDGTLTDTEAVELETLLATDPASCARHLASVRLEYALRGLRTEFDIATTVVARIEADRVARTTSVVMAAIARCPHPHQPSQRYRFWIGSAGLVAATILAIWVSLLTSQHRHIDESSQYVQEFARLTARSGDVEIVGGRVTAGEAYRLLTRGQTIRTIGEDSIAELEFPDRTRVEIYPESTVRIASEQGVHPCKLVLIEGRLTASASGQIIVVGGTAEVVASAGSFSVCSAGSGSARIESLDGKLHVSRGPSINPMILGPGQATFISADAVEPRETTWHIETEPRARLEFAALDVAFTPEGEVWAMSAKQWARWKPGSTDPQWFQFLPKVFNDGLASWMTPDRQAVAICRIDDRDNQITIRELPSGIVRGRIPVRVSEPRFLCVGPDGSWIATVDRQKPSDRQVHVWDVGTGTLRFRHQFSNTASCLAASADGRRLAVGITDLSKQKGNLVAVLDPVSGQQRFELPTHYKAASTLTFSPDGTQLAVGFNGVIQLWDVSSQSLRRTFNGFERGITRIAFSPRGERLAAGTTDGQVWLWSIVTGQCLQVISTGTRGVRSLAFSADGTRLVTATNKAAVAVWDVVSEHVPIPDEET